MRGLIHEIRRRNVHRVALAYLGASWLLVQVLETVLPVYGVDDAVIRWVILSLLVAFVPVLAIAWAFEWTAKGIRTQDQVDRDPELASRSSRRADRVVIAVLSLAVLVFAVDRFLLERAPPEPAKSIAVLPFDDMSPERDQLWLADGLAGELLNLLAQNNAIQVVARTSSFKFRGHESTIDDIAAQLGVAYVLEGSVRRDADRVRVTAQLIDADSGFHLWSETYNEALDDIFALQERIARQIAGALEAEMLGAPARPSTTPQNYVTYLEAQYLARQNTVESRQSAIGRLQTLVENDPDYAPAWTMLSALYGTEAASGVRDYDAGFRLAKDAALTAVRTGSEFSGGYMQLAWIAQWYESDLQAAAGFIERALELEPGDAEILGNAAILLLHMGKLERSVVVSEYSASLSPVDPIAYFNLGLGYQYADRLEDAERAFEKVLDLSPDYAGAAYQLGLTQLLKGDVAFAVETWRRVPPGENRDLAAVVGYFAEGRSAESNAALEALIERWGDQWPSVVVHAHAFRGEIDEAFAWLEKEYQKFGSAGWGEWRYQRLFDNLRGDPRWSEFLARVGVSDDQLARYTFDVPTP